MMTRRKSKMEENIEAYRPTHPTYKQFCQKQNVWPVCSEFSIYNSIIFLEYLREIFTRKQQCSSVESSLSSVEIFFLILLHIIIQTIPSLCSEWSEISLWKRRKTAVNLREKFLRR